MTTFRANFEVVVGKFDWVVFGNGRARFCGGQRDTINGGGQELFAVQLENGPPYYGQFDAKYEADQTHYNVEILSFGFAGRSVVGHPVIAIRHAFSSDEIANIRSIISSLMLYESEKPFPLHRTERFLGKTLFVDGWIREK